MSVTIEPITFLLRWMRMDYAILRPFNSTVLSGYKTGFPILWNDYKISPKNFAIIRVLPFLNSPKDKTDLDFWDCFGRKKIRLITEEIRYVHHNRMKRG